jgi:hypothetical protein
VVVVKELAAELQVQLAAELGNALSDVGGLGIQILLIVKTDLSGQMWVPPFFLRQFSFSSRGTLYHITF